ncbi:MAG: DUF1772 domain-containing protein [Saprospiraceae bacterium]|nr:DUF1772 domain-containing protein [Saprospiraceae bacterium]
MIGQILLFLSSGILGIFVGAQVTEAVLFVPYWKSLPPDQFFDLHKTYGKKIHQFFAPLTILATLVPLGTAFYFISNGTEDALLFVMLGGTTVMFFSTYFLFFKNSNKKFAQRSISDDGLGPELDRWSRWHWGRVAFELVAFGISLWLLLVNH